MSVHKSPTTDSQRLENLLAAWCSPDDDAYEEDEEEEAPAAKGIDFDAWAEEIRDKVERYAESADRKRAADAAMAAATPEADDEHKAAGGGRRG